MLKAPQRLLSKSSGLAALAILSGLILPQTRRALPLETVSRREIEGLHADLYLPAGRPAPGIVLVVGALREGRRYPILETAAQTIGACGYAVLVPELGRLRRLILGEDALDDLVAATLALPRQPGVLDRPVALIGFSLGGSLALLAAADDRTRGHIAAVGDLGGYFRLIDMLTAATTATARGAPVSLAAPSVYAVAASVAGLLPDRDARFLDSALDGHRDSPLEALAAVDTAELGTEARGALALLRNRDPGRVQPLVDQVEGLGVRMARLSPQSAVDRIEVPVWVLHDERDRFVPAQQSQLMQEALAGRRNFRFFRTRLLEHTEPSPPGRNPVRFAREYVPGLVSLYRFARGPLAALRSGVNRDAGPVQLER